jgi:hypothetical protein
MESVSSGWADKWSVESNIFRHHKKLRAEENIRIFYFGKSFFFLASGAQWRPMAPFILGAYIPSGIDCSPDRPL